MLIFYSWLSLRCASRAGWDHGKHYSYETQLQCEGNKSHSQYQTHTHSVHFTKGLPLDIALCDVVPTLSVKFRASLNEKNPYSPTLENRVLLQC